MGYFNLGAETGWMTGRLCEWWAGTGLEDWLDDRTTLRVVGGDWPGRLIG